MPASRLTALLLVAALPLAACSGEKKAETATASGVVRTETPAPEAPVQRAAPQTAIQTQPGPEGAQVDLLKVAVTGDILTVTLRCSGEQTYNTETFQISNISVVEDATAQRLSVLRDNAGAAMVSNYNPNGAPARDYLSADCGAKTGIIWAKFPAPAATSPTVSINFPGIAPFDGIPVAR